jgi:hypothetical protein
MGHALRIRGAPAIGYAILFGPLYSTIARHNQEIRGEQFACPEEKLESPDV